LAAIWAELLCMERIAIHDDVFDLGAHSLMAVNAVSRIRDVFRVDLQLRNLFERPTIAGLAEAIDALLWLARGKAPAADALDREQIDL
jgi:acyl carrier protein